ncbi:MAG TPA: hypothetical protein VNR38_21030 [Ureibacillus sp.]|nr:hypothetical protein [Ureibacillus sp.]
MQHIKNYYCVEMETRHGLVVIEGPVSPEKLSQYTLHENLTSFRPPAQQKHS